MDSLRYVRVMSEGKTEGETDRGIGAAAVVTQPVFRTVVVKRGHSHKLKLHLGCCRSDLVLDKA